MNNRVLAGGVIGGIAFFLLGYLVYGLALATMMAENTMAGLNRPMEEMQWLHLILSNLALGFLLAYVLSKANSTSFSSGATIGAVIGLLFSAAINFALYATTNYWNSMTGVFVDIIASIVMCAIVGGIIGWWYGRGRKAVVA